jgi:alkaline phosphatase
MKIKLLSRRASRALAFIAAAGTLITSVSGADAKQRGARAAAPARPTAATPRRARNVIVFLGDAGGLPTLSAAGILAHDRPQSLFIQSMPHIGLSDTSSRNRWVTDSAAGMTAIMTGHKTDNGVVSMLPQPNGARVAVKTFLEHAEERGLSTGVVTNMPIWDATPAATYAHVASRKNKDEVLAQLLKPRFGDGVDVIVGRGAKDAMTSFAKHGQTPAQAFAAAGYQYGDDPALIARAPRAAVLRDSDYAPLPVVEATIGQLVRNPRGYFLMVEWDMHTDDPRAGLRHVIEMDDMIRRVAQIAGPDTLILFTADHSFGLRMNGGERGHPLVTQFVPSASGDDPVISVEDTHTGEEVIAAAQGPGAEQVQGFFANTALFAMLMKAMNW